MQFELQNYETLTDLKVSISIVNRNIFSSVHNKLCGNTKFDFQFDFHLQSDFCFHFQTNFSSISLARKDNDLGVLRSNRNFPAKNVTHYLKMHKARET